MHLSRGDAGLFIGNRSKRLARIVALMHALGFCVFAVACASVVKLTVLHIHVAQVDVQAFLGALLFIAVFVIPLAGQANDWQQLRRDLHGLPLVGGLGFCFWIAALAFTSDARILNRPVLIIGVFIPALIEEYAFRKALNRRLIAVFAVCSRSRPLVAAGAAILSAAAFAGCHFLAPGLLSSGDGVHEALRLFIAGLLYSCVVAAGGLWMAVGVHAAMNTQVLDAGYSISHRASPAELVIGLVLALAVIASHSLGIPPSGGRV